MKKDPTMTRNEIMVFDPHPDDADWWTGGLTILLKKLGWNITYVCVGPTTEETRKHAHQSAELLGVERLFLEIPIRNNDNFARDLRAKAPALVRDRQARMVFIPPVCDYHMEHVRLGRELFSLFHWSAMQDLGFTEVYAYDSHENRQPVEIYIDISSVWEQHRESLAKHAHFRRQDVPDGTLIRVKQGRAQLLGASLPAPPVMYAEGYCLLQGNVKNISSLARVLPEQFYYRHPAGLLAL